jgi:hypothetical protein
MEIWKFIANAKLNREYWRIWNPDAHAEMYVLRSLAIQGTEIEIHRN